MDLIRCQWSQNHELLTKYHDTEWGLPTHDDLKLFEFIILDSFQAGLSWLTILKKRENFRKAFDNFNPELIQKYDENKILELMNDISIIRNKLKILAAVNNASKYFEIVKEFDSFDKYIWSFTGGKTIVNEFKNMGEVPAKTELSDNMSKDLLSRGFKFVGSTICYAFMQAAGIVNDHTTDCFRYHEVINNINQD